MSTDTHSTLKTDPMREVGNGVPPNGPSASSETARSGRDASIAGVHQFKWSSDTVQRLDEEVQWAVGSNPAGPAGVAGLLLGKNGPEIEIADCHPVLVMQPEDYAYALRGPGRREFERTITSFQSNSEHGLSVIGYYRGQMGEIADLTEEDLSLIRTCFGDACRVVLSINIASDQSRHVKLFSGDGARALSEFHSAQDGSQIPKWLELWYHLSGDGVRDATPVKNATESIEVATGEEAPIQSRDDAPIQSMEKVSKEFIPLEKASSRSRRLVFAGTFIVALLIGILIFEASVWLKQEAHARGGTAVQVRAGSSHDSELTLRAKRDGNDLRLDWDHTAPVLAKASGGILTIRDGNAQEKNVTLDGDLLRTGAVVYRPMHESVFLRLVILGTGGTKLGESIAQYPQPVSSGR